jgi:hypothetical protein
VRVDEMARTAERQSLHGGERDLREALEQLAGLTM